MRLEVSWGGFSGCLESSVERLETPEGDWRALGGVWRPLGSDLKAFGRFWGSLVGALGALGIVLKISWELLRLSYSRLKGSFKPFEAV